MVAASFSREALGLGAKPAHYDALLAGEPRVGFLEALSENFLGDAPVPRARLSKLRERYPVVLHGVGLGLLNPEPPSEAHLDALCRLADALDAPYVTEHLCWTGAGGVSHHDLLPVPYVPELVELAAERAAYVQKRLGRPFGLENLSTYLELERSTMSEWDFYTRVAREAGCGLLLDLNNIYVSSHNHGLDAREYLDAVDWSRVLEVHLAGPSEEPDGSLVDTHATAVREPVWALYREAWRRGGPFPTLLEWDEQLPSWPALLAELDRARAEREAP